MKKWNLLVVCLSFFSSLLHAGDKVGNGGYVVVCKRDSSSRPLIFLLDYYEAEVIYKIKPSRSYPATGIDAFYMENARKIIETLGRFDPGKRDRYLQWLKTFSYEAAFLGDVDLIDVDDSKHLFVKVGCKVEQIAIQRRPLFANDKIYLINKRLWDYADASVRGGLVVHEIIYRDSLERGDGHAAKVRYFTAVISSDMMKTLTKEEYLELLESVALPYD